VNLGEKMMHVTLTTPDDCHLHLRDGARMADAVAHTARSFGRAVVMPNLVPPVTTLEAAAAYRERIVAALPAGAAFEPLMTLYLTDGTTATEVRRAAAGGIVRAVKLYPSGATTNSESGVTDIDRLGDVLATLSEVGLPLLVHGEVTDPGVDVFDREAVFIERVLEPIVKRYDDLKVVLEHVTTAEGVAFVEGARAGVAATVTPHHLLMSRDALFAGGFRPHHYCLPVLKRERHRRELVRAATSGNPRFFLGTDSAPHPRTDKEAGCGCAGIFSAHAALPLYAEVFEEAGALDRLQAFAAHHGADFYGLPRNEGTVTLERESWTVPETFPFGDDVVVPLRAAGPVHWRLLP
jgi:dihydroorotase